VRGTRRRRRPRASERRGLPTEAPQLQRGGKGGTAQLHGTDGRPSSTVSQQDAGAGRADPTRVKAHQLSPPARARHNPVMKLQRVWDRQVLSACQARLARALTHRRVVVPAVVLTALLIWAGLGTCICPSGRRSLQAAEHVHGEPCARNVCLRPVPSVRTCATARSAAAAADRCRRSPGSRRLAVCLRQQL